MISLDLRYASMLMAELTTNTIRALASREELFAVEVSRLILSCIFQIVFPMSKLALILVSTETNLDPIFAEFGLVLVTILSALGMHRLSLDVSRACKVEIS